MKKYILIMLFAIICSPVYAVDEEPGYFCEAVVDNKVYIKGDCVVELSGDNMIQIENKKRKSPFFYIIDDKAYWNGPAPYYSKAQTPLGNVVSRETEEGGMCFSNQRVKLCYIPIA